MENQGLRPNVDYSVIFSLKQATSIEGLAKGEYEAAAVSDDKLQSLLQAGTVSPNAYRVIYKSEVIPRTTIGWFYNLKPELADKVKQAILTYVPKPDSNDPSAVPLHFIAIDYKKDFQTVREIDDRFDPRFNAKAKAKQTADDTAPPTTGPSAL
jgi:phosphonate transport system substrate-binding protein